MISKKDYPDIKKNCGAAHYGRPVTLPGVAAVRPYSHYSAIHRTTKNAKIDCFANWAAYIPALNGGVLCYSWINCHNNQPFFVSIDG